MGGFLLIAD
jgi:U4/U6 small nuclear ribonucleoprotein PRP3